MPELYEDTEDTLLQFKLNTSVVTPGGIHVKYKNLEYPQQTSKINIFQTATGVC